MRAHQDIFVENRNSPWKAVTLPPHNLKNWCDYSKANYNNFSFLSPLDFSESDITISTTKILEVCKYVKEFNTGIYLENFYFYFVKKLS